LDDGLDAWVDDEALVFVDVEDRAALATEVIPVATMLTRRFGQLRQPVFGVALFTGQAGARTAALDADRLDHLERLLADCAHRGVFEQCRWYD